MRALLGILLLGGLFLTVAGWQLGHSRSVRARRSDRYGPGPLQRDDGWSLLVLGNASEAPPIEHPTGRGSRGSAHGRRPRHPRPSDPAAPAPPAQSYAPDYRYVVQAGDVLGRICRRYYGSASPALVEALARYNGLASADAIREGDALLLPDRARLDP